MPLHHADRCRQDPDSWEVLDNDPVDVRIGEIAACQGGRITTSQLVALGLSRSTIHHRVRVGRLICEHRSVYRVGYRAPGREGRWHGALAAVHGGALSFWDAGSKHELWFSDRPAVHVTVDGYSGRNHRDDVRVHRMRLPETHVEVLDGLRVTTVARTVVDMAFVMTRKQLVHVLDRAERREDFALVDLAAIVGSFKRRKGIPALRRLIAHRHPESNLLDTALERACLALIERAGAPQPRIQLVLNDYRADFAWPELELILEVDGFEWHKTRADASKDAKRALELEARGWRVLRLTDDQVYWEQDWVVSTLAAVFTRSLARRSQ